MLILKVLSKQKKLLFRAQTVYKTQKTNFKTTKRAKDILIIPKIIIVRAYSEVSLRL